MTLLVASGQITSPGSAQSVAYTGITTFTPKVVLFFSAYRAAESAAANMWAMRGAADAAGNNACTLFQEGDSQGTSNTIAATQNDGCIVLNTNNSATVRQQVALTAVSATGFTLNWTTSTINDSRIHWIALGGNGLSAKVGTIASGTDTSNLAVTGVGFQPKVVLFLSGRVAAVSTVTAAPTVGQIGMGAAVDATHRWSTAISSDDAEATAEDTGQAVFTDRVAHTYLVNQALDLALDFVSMDADGFTVVPDDAASADTWVHYIALGGASLSAAIGTDAQKTSSGTQAKTGVGFLPEALIFAGNGGVSAGTVADGISATSGFAHGAVTRCIFGSSDHGGANSVAGSGATATKCLRYVTGATPTTVAEAGLSSFDSDGYTLDWTTADATARLFGFVALAFTTTVTITSNGGGATASVNVAENTTAVTTVVATTTGEGVTYSITGGADQAKFNIGSSTGVLTFASAPNFETPTDANADNDYVVIVTATDGGGVATDSQTITATVTNVAPTITSNGGGATANISVAENTTAVTTVTATDAGGGTLTYSISAGADSALFGIDSSSGVLTFLSAPDYEHPTDANTDNDYVVTVRVSDGTATDTQALTITVTDVLESSASQKVQGMPGLGLSSMGMRNG